MRLILPAAAALVLLTACHPDEDKAIVQEVVTKYHQAVAKGDAKAAMKDFAEDALMLESGVLETRRQYEENHLPADIDFEKQVKNTVETVDIGVEGNAAWVISKMDLTGNYEGSELSIEALELMVLAKVDGDWKIKSIAWNSHRK